MSYWDQRYGSGGTSGPGSRGAEALHKASLVRRAIAIHEIGSLLDLGCGDGVQAALIAHPGYLGYDPSPLAVEKATAAWPAGKFTSHLPKRRFDAVLSMDVLFHFPEDADYQAYLAQLFGMAERFVLVYGTDHDQQGASHVRHRKWTTDIPEGWRVLAQHAGPFKTFWVVGR